MHHLPFSLYILLLSITIIFELSLPVVLIEHLCRKDNKNILTAQTLIGKITEGAGLHETALFWNVAESSEKLSPRVQELSPRVQELSLKVQELSLKV